MKTAMEKLTLGVFLVVAAGSAYAGRIEFTDPAWSGANGETSFGNGNVTISTNTGNLSQGSSFGIGIKSGLDDLLLGTGDEIDDDVFGTDEVLTVEFSKATVVRQIELLNLFLEIGGAENYGISVTPESGPGTVLTGPITAPTNAAGLWTVGLASSLGPISKLEFFVPGNFDFKSDFSVGAIVTPLPAAVWMFGAALLGLFGLRRRIQNKANA